MSNTDNNNMAEIALQTIASACQLPIVKVSRDNFLREEFKNSKYLDVILKEGPQAVYSMNALRQRATKLVNSSTKKNGFRIIYSGFTSKSSNCGTDYYHRCCAKYGICPESGSKGCLFIWRR